MEPRLLRVEVPFAVVGAEVWMGYVVRAAPLIAWAVDKPVVVLTRWAERKGGSWAWVG